jgi:hypothetical protein
MGVNHGSAVSLRIKRQAKIEAKSFGFKAFRPRTRPDGCGGFLVKNLQ